MSLLTDGKLAATVANALAGIVYPITIERTASVYDPISGGVVETVTTYTAKGFLSSFNAQEVAAGIVQAGDVKVTLIAAGLPITITPSTDKVQANGQTITIISSRSDPAGATVVIQGR